MIKKRDKRGEDLLQPVIIFIVLNLLFFVTLGVFISKASSGALVYEQTYAKEIALVIDEAKPEMFVFLDFKKAVEIAQENGFDKDKIVKFEGNKVVVKLSSRGGYSQEYFSNYKVTPKVEGEKLVLAIENV